MTAPAPDSTPDSRSGTVTAGQAAHAAACFHEGIDDADEVAALWQGLDDSELDYWADVSRAAVAEFIDERAAQAAIAAAAPADPEQLSESQQFQVSEARDILGTWDLNSPGGVSRETVLADQVRALLAIVDQLAAAAPAPAGEARLLTARQERQPSREVNLITDDERDEPECLASHCPPSMYVDCEWPKCATVVEQPQAAPGADVTP